ncbi:MAG: D-alanyl-D-alanine carboxypeptidase [Chitinophagaceae bacterium]|nr:D-alanyl-D-alanine carboxypeptidase [Chitinophagaceae bacterium]
MAESAGKKFMTMVKFFLHITCLLFVCSCVAQKATQKKSPLDDLLSDTTFRNAHIGVSVYDPATRKYLYSYQANKYFVPASNVKIATCYTVMKYLGHILPGVKYFENDTAIYLVPTGDPTFLHRDYKNQPVFDFLKKTNKRIFITDSNWKDKELGQGWSWDDYNDEYMVERNSFPVYGNTLKWVQEKVRSNAMSTEESFSIYSDPEVNWKVRFEPDSGTGKFKVTRDRLSNVFVITEGREPNKEVLVPFILNGLSSALELLPDTLGKKIEINNNFFLTDPQQHVVLSQPVDSVLRPMMYRSDNFFAEQLLLLASEAKTGVMNATAIIDTMVLRLKNKPVWVDGSGLSRYNLFSPNTFIEILDSIRLEVGMDRVKEIFPTGDSGTLKGYYVADNGKIYAKTGSMSGVIALSGYLYGKGKRLLIFSVLVNNYNGLNRDARRRIEKFIKALL